MFNEIRRFFLIIRIMFIYQLDEYIPRTKIAFLMRLTRKIYNVFFWIKKEKKIQRKLGESLRLACQELGPIWIKFGQMLSTRFDLFSISITNQLAMLQDQVSPFNNVKEYIEQIIGHSLEKWFNDFKIYPLASASIAQVHVAYLKNGKEVIVKVIRPNIISVIKDDIRLMYRLAYWISKLLPNSQHLRLVEVVIEYEKTILSELNLLHEATNAIQLRHNFKNSKLLYIPKIYLKYCNKNIIVMERIYGIPINDVLALKKQGINMKLLAERGVQIFFTQVFRDSFFHADMHPGNIFVSYENPENPMYIGIDFGIVGSLNKEDKKYLAENLIAFFNRDYHKVAELHVNSGWVDSNTSIEDFEFSIRNICEPFFKKPLSQISFGYFLLSLFKTAKQFNMKVQPQLILLQKTLLYIEGIGKQLYPQLDLWKTAKIYLEVWIKEQFGLLASIRTFKKKIPYWIEKLPEIPELIFDSFKQHRLLKNSINQLTVEIKMHCVRQNRSFILFNIGTVLLFIGVFLLIQSIYLRLISILLIIVGVISWTISWKYTK